jgi:hypothetical protein
MNITPQQILDAKARIQKRYRISECCNKIPWMPDDQLIEMIESVQKVGVLVPVVRYKGVVLDGRHRLVCADLSRKKITFIELSEIPGGSEAAYIIGLNFKRRDHLTKSQKAALAVEMLELESAKGKENRQKNLKQGNEAPDSPGPRAIGKKSSEIIAEQAGVSVETLEEAQTLKREEPELFQQVADGNKSVYAATKERKAKKEKTRAPEKPVSSIEQRFNALVDSFQLECATIPRGTSLSYPKDALRGLSEIIGNVKKYKKFINSWKKGKRKKCPHCIKGVATVNGHTVCCDKCMSGRAGLRLEDC